MTTIQRLSRDNISFIFIDLQEKLLTKIPESERLVSRNKLLLEAANLLGLPYVTTTQYKKGLGEIASTVRESSKLAAMDKTTFSCARDPHIVQQLASLGRKSILISGVETHICVLQTCLDLIRDGYEVSVVADAVGARTQTDHDLGMKRMEGAGALLVTAEMVIYELIGRSDSDEFKKILPLIKQL